MVIFENVKTGPLESPTNFSDLACIGHIDHVLVFVHFVNAEESPGIAAVVES